MARVLRIQRTTVFAFGEGESERAFLKHIRSLYSSEKTNVRISDAGGGNPDHIVDKAIRVRGSIKYNYSCLLVDTDVVWEESLKSKASRKGFELIGNRPCIEALFLAILASQNHSSKSSKDCKKLFQANYSHSSNAITESDCKKLFPKNILDQKRASIQQLNRLIEIMEANF